MLDNLDKVSQNLPIQLHAVNLNDKSYVYRNKFGKLKPIRPSIFKPGAAGARLVS